LRIRGALELYSALPPWRDRLPKSVDEMHYEECRLIIDCLQQLSRTHRYEFDFYLDDVYVGQLKDGDMDICLQKGLLEEWRKGLDAY
jgi:hypothetical protein